MSKDSPVTFNHKLFWGEHKLLLFPTDNGQSVIDTWTLRWELWDSSDKLTNLITKTTGSGITIVDLTTGTSQVALTAADWATVLAGTSYYYEMWRTDAGAEQVLAFGEFYVR